MYIVNDYVWRSTVSRLFYIQFQDNIQKQQKPPVIIYYCIINIHATDMSLVKYI